MPFPADDGGAVSIQSASRSLESVGIDLQILALNQLNNPVKIAEIPIDFKTRTKLQWVDINNRISIFGAIKSLVTRKSYLSFRFSSKQFEKVLEAVLTEKEFDIIQLEHLYLWHYIRVIRLHSKAKIILRSQNIEHQLWYSIAGDEKRWLVRMWLLLEVSKLKRIESSIPLLLDGVAAISEDDATFFREKSESIPVRFISMAIESDRTLANKVSVENSRTKCYHLGSMDWRPNLSGIQWIFDEVIALVDANTEFHFAGKKMPQNLLKKNDGERFFITGNVNKASEFINDKDVLLVPLQSGGGVRVKILEALSNAKIVISTSWGCRGLPPELINCIEVADTPLQFANKIMEVSENTNNFRIKAQSGKTFLDNHLTFGKVGEQYLNFYKSVTHLKVFDNRL